MILVALVNLGTGLYILYDASLRLLGRQDLLIFDDYLGGFARYIPLFLGASMVLVSLLLLFKKSSTMLFYSYVNSFLFLLFFTPSVFYSGLEDRYSPWTLVLQFSVMITCTILLYATRERGKGRAKVRPRMTYEEYKKSMKKFTADQDKSDDPPAGS